MRYMEARGVRSAVGCWVFFVTNIRLLNNEEQETARTSKYESNVNAFLMSGVLCGKG